MALSCTCADAKQHEASPRLTIMTTLTELLEELKQQGKVRNHDTIRMETASARQAQAQLPHACAQSGPNFGAQPAQAQNQRFDKHTRNIHACGLA
jgi:hypothetical protein